MAVPKKAKSKSRRDMRRSHHALNAPSVINCPNCGEPMRLHRICATCGYYKGREVIRMDEEG